jgi:hypothetical protein
MGWCWEFGRRSKECKLYWAQHIELEQKVEKKEINYGEFLDFQERNGIFKNSLDIMNRDQKWDNYSAVSKYLCESFRRSVISLKWWPKWKPDSVHSVEVIEDVSCKVLGGIVKGDLVRMYVKEGHHVLNPHSDRVVEYTFEEKKCIVSYFLEI